MKRKVGHRAACSVTTRILLCSTFPIHRVVYWMLPEFILLLSGTKHCATTRIAIIRNPKNRHHFECVSGCAPAHPTAKKTHPYDTPVGAALREVGSQARNGEDIFFSNCSADIPIGVFPPDLPPSPNLRPSFPTRPPSWEPQPLLDAFVACLCF
jgi:hypothetical protein